MPKAECPTLADVCRLVAFDVGVGNMVYAGVDPGSSGAVAFVYDGRAFVADVPTVTTTRASGRKKTDADAAAVATALHALRPIRHTILFAVEEAQVYVPRKGREGEKGSNNAFTAFRVGVGYGVWLGALAAFRYPFVAAAPVTWKKGMGLTRDKEVSRLTAARLFPNAAAALARKKDHDRAEAILLAEWVRRRSVGKLT